MTSVNRISAFILAAPAAALLLSGCVGTSTYGTGKTQEEQLYDDLLGIAALGGPKKSKERINYLSRPGLVNPPQTAALPAPAEKVSNQAGYFPSDPETQRARRLAGIAEAEANGSDLPADVVAARREAAVRSRNDRGVGAAASGWEEIEREKTLITKEQRARFLRERAQRKGAIGAAPRQYLTEPPSPYRTPKQTAVVGTIGEKERDPYKSGESSSFFSSIFGDKK